MNRIDNSIVMNIRPRVELIGPMVQLPPEDRQSLNHLTNHQSFGYYRTSQDGNSFYRCLVISWLATRQSVNISDAFPNLSGMNLCIIPERNVPPQLRPYYQTQRLNVILSECWDEMKGQLEKNYEQTVREYINSHLVFDFTLNLYIRALINLQYLGQKGDGFEKKSRSSEMCQYGQEPSEECLKTAAIAIGTTLRIVEKKGKQMTVELYRFTPAGNEGAIEMYKIDGGYHYVVLPKGLKEQKKRNLIESPVAPTKKQPSYEALPVTPDCERCPWMKNGRCFKCSMLQFRSQAYQKITGRQSIDNIQKLKNRIQQQKSWKAEEKAQEKVVKAAEKEVLKCLECSEILKKQSEIQKLICSSCSKKVQLEERLHEYRSKTMEKKIVRPESIALPKTGYSGYPWIKNSNYVGRKL